MGPASGSDWWALTYLSARGCQRDSSGKDVRLLSYGATARTAKRRTSRAEPSLMQSAWFRHHNGSSIDGLFFLGAGTHPGAGVPEFSARFACSTVPFPIPGSVAVYKTCVALRGGPLVACQQVPPNRRRAIVELGTRARIDALINEGCEIFDRFDLETRQRAFHPFVAADYSQIFEALLAIRGSVQSVRDAARPTFLELGSATGVITIIADLLGFEAAGIELDPSLVVIARQLAERYESRARFVAGSFLPAGYRWKSATGDGRLGTIGSGPSAYLELGHALSDFDVVYGYPWDGEAPILLDLMQKYGHPKAKLLMMDPVAGPKLANVGHARSA